LQPLVYWKIINEIASLDLLGVNQLTLNRLLGPQLVFTHRIFSGSALEPFVHVANTIYNGFQVASSVARCDVLHQLSLDLLQQGQLEIIAHSGEVSDGHEAVVSKFATPLDDVAAHRLAAYSAASSFAFGS